MTPILSWMDNPQENTLDTMYDCSEKTTHPFVDGNGNTYLFHSVENAGLEPGHLSEEFFVGHHFGLTYRIAKELDGDPNETFGRYIGTGLSLVY
ncbi:hypothetical protein [Flagellimonas baculiformis]|uniref:hypothetical protein n=1 Tax=Flagellimonas baculiformis TaxID=3067310 RepID=UPI00296F6969|nr:hypothetical protein [Muricauda sp. D6]